jgi:uncharacterized membrane protein (UPF0127 family)
VSFEARVAGLPTRERDGLVVHVAQTHRAKLRGLARLDAMPSGHALELPATRSVHTFGMRFALDLYWLDSDGATIRVDRSVGPRRVRTCRRAKSVIEAPAGYTRPR